MCLLRELSDHIFIYRYNIKLQFPVKTDTSFIRHNRKYIAWKDSEEKLIYVTLEAPDAGYLADDSRPPTFQTIQFLVNLILLQYRTTWTLLEISSPNFSFGFTSGINYMHTYVLLKYPITAVSFRGEP